MQPAVKKRFIRITALSAIALFGVLPATSVGLAAPVFAADTLAQAKQKYEAKDYQGALDAFKALTVKYPKSALCHYYLALCNQNLSHSSEAKAEYLWVINNDDSSLAKMAATGYSQLTGKPAPASAASSVRTVMDFYTTWCQPCKMMEPAFEAAKTKYRNIDFKRFDAEKPENKALVKQYRVQAYPTIVMLNSSGKVLFNQPGSLVGDEFAQAIDMVNGGK